MRYRDDTRVRRRTSVEVATFADAVSEFMVGRATTSDRLVPNSFDHFAYSRRSLVVANVDDGHHRFQ